MEKDNSDMEKSSAVKERKENGQKGNQVENSGRGSDGWESNTTHLALAISH